MTDLEQHNQIISTKELSPDIADDSFQGAADNEVELREVRVPLEGHGARLDRVLADIVPEFSRSYLQQMIAAGQVQVNDLKLTKSSVRVKAMDSISIELKPTPQSQAFRPEIMALDVVFEDDFLLVINKPAGLVVHPAPGNWSGTLLNGLLARDARACLLPRAGIVHRLDKDTSGLMVVARQRQVMDQLVCMIAVHSVSRQYLALAHGAWQGQKVRQVELAVGRDPRNRLRMAVVDLSKYPGKTATTEIALLQSGLRHCLVQCRLRTGRTHQIRVHMAALGHPLVSDELYGGRQAAGLMRQALHACKLAFEHPVTGQYMEFNSALPGDMQTAIDDLGLRYNEFE